MEKRQGQRDQTSNPQSGFKIDLTVDTDTIRSQPGAALQRLLVAPPPDANSSDLLALQRVVGNRQVGRLLVQREQRASALDQTGAEALNSIESGHTTRSFPAVQRDRPPPATAIRSGQARTDQVTRDIARYRTTTMAGYVRAVQAMEAAFPHYNPRQILAMLRQVYYGRPWSASPTEQWRDVLPQSPDMPDPRAGRTRGLYHALQQSTIIDGIDIGHVLTGMEAVINPTRQVELEIPGPNYVATMPNTEFATWGGDLGSAAGQAVADHELNPPARSDMNYFRELASNADLVGDIDAFVMQRGARNVGGLASMLRGSGQPASGTPVSQILRQYYLTTDTPLGRVRSNRYSEFISSIGGRVSGRTISNRAQLIGPISHRVSSFARLWYANQYRNARMPGVGHAGAAQALHVPGPQLLLHLLAKSMVMVNLFLDWLQTRL